MDGNVNAVRLWVASGADINVVDDGNNTPLMRASQFVHRECVEEMLRLGADVRRLNGSDWTALHWAATYRTRRQGAARGVVRVLIVAGCDAAVRDIDGCTAVERARVNYGVEEAEEFEGWVAFAAT